MKRRLNPGAPKQALGIRTGSLLAATIIVSALLGTLALPISSVPATAVEGERLPDLAIAPLEDLTVDIDAEGRRLLRFSATVLNVGSGPLEVRGIRDRPDQASMRVTQVIHGPGGHRERATRARMTYAGDGHDHWHVHAVMRYQIVAEDGGRRASEKTGFCFWDNRRHDLALHDAPQDPIYAASLCGNLRSVDNRMGLSVGWGDRYRSTLAWQWVELTSLPDGRYTLVAEADPGRVFLERDRANNCTALTVDIAGTTVEAVETGNGDACRPQLPVRPCTTGHPRGVTAATGMRPGGICPRII